MPKVPENFLGMLCSELKNRRHLKKTEMDSIPAYPVEIKMSETILHKQKLITGTICRPGKRGLNLHQSGTHNKGHRDGGMQHGAGRKRLEIQLLVIINKMLSYC